MAHSGKTMTFATDLVPQEDNIYSLGTDSLKWIIRGSLPLSDITGADDLKAIEAISGTTGLLKKTAANTWTLDTSEYVTSSGITSVTIGATSPVQSSTSTAQSGSSASTTISLKDAYGDTKNPYGTKTKNLVLAGPSSGSNAAPTFRALVAADIPDISGTYVKKVTSTDNAIVRFDDTTGAIQNSKVTINDNGTITLPTEQNINLRMNRKNAEGGGWAHGYLNWYDNADNIFAVMGLYGTNDALDHIYIGSNTSYNSDVNLQIYANGTIKGKLFSGSGASLTSLNASNLASGTVPVARLPLATTSAAGAVKVGSGISVSDGTISVTAGNLGLSSALRYQGTTTTAMSDGLTTATVKINNADFTPSAGDVVIYNDAEYLWTGSLWELIGAESSFKKVQTAVNSSSASGNSATTFVSSVTQDTQGVITVKTSTLNTSGTWSGNAATATKLKDNATNTTRVFYRGDNTWSNILKQTAASALGIDTNRKIGTAIKDLHFTVGSGSGTGINDGNAGGITIGTDTASYGGIYWQSSGSYGLRLHFATTGSFANGAYTRMLITHDGKVGIGTLTPDTLLTVNGNAKADKFIGALQGNADTATALTSNAGDGEQPVYFSGGKPVATSYSLAASVSSGTANFLTKYTSARAIGNSSIYNVPTLSYSTITPDYTSGGEQFYKAWLVYVSKNYANADLHIGVASPNSQGPILGNIYNVNDRNETTELPRYSTFLFHNLSGVLESFGTNNYNYYHRTYLTDSNASTILGLGTMASETATNYLKWQTTSSASTALYNFGVYVAQNTAAGTGPNGSNYYSLINIPYRKASGNTKLDWGWQLGNATANDNRLYYRTTGDNTAGDWQTIAHATTSSNNTGSTTQPVYMTSAGVITAITAVGAAYGGTGKTTLKDSANALINALDTGSSDLTANDYVITQYVGGGTTTTSYHRRPANKVVNATLVKAALGTDTSTTTKWLNKKGEWSTPTAAQVGAITKLSSSTDNAIVRFDGTTGAIQDSGVTINDNDHLIAPAIRIANTYYGVSFGRTTGTPKETILHTGIKWVSSTHMPVIHITGYAYGLQSPVEFKIGFYIYGDKIGWSGATNMGSWEPDIYLFKDTRSETNYVAVGLAGSCYFLQLSVDLQDEMGKFNNVIPTDWSWDFLTTEGTIPSTDDGTTCVKVPYKASIFGAKYASITTTSNAIAYYTNTTGTFGSKASANGALYATSANGALQWGTLPIAQGGTGATTAANARTNLGLGTMALETAANYLARSGGQMTGSLTWKDSTALPETTSGQYFLVIDAFASGGTTKWIGKANVLTSIGAAPSSHNHAASDINSGTLDLARIPTITNAKLANSKVIIAGNDVSLGGSLTAATLTSSLGLSNALHFIGITSTTLTDGSTTATLTAKSTGSLSKTTGFVDGDVVMDGDQLREYVWSGSAWRLLGITTSTAYTQPASTATNTWIAQVSQGTDGKITATTGSLDTSGTWSGTASKTTTTANTSDSIYPVGVKSGATTTLLHDTSITMKGNAITAVTYNSTAASLTSETSTTANTAKYATLTLGNNANVNSTTAHSEGQIVMYSAATQAHTIKGTSTTTAYTHTLPNNTGLLVSLSGGTAKGSSTKPVYIPNTGIVTECSTYAGGTKVTFNGADKGASTASFYAPTGGGTAGHVLIGAGTTAAPAWYGGTVMSGSAAASWKTAFNGTTDATASNAAAVTVAGGLGIAKSLIVGTTATITNNTRSPIFTLTANDVDKAYLQYNTDDDSIDFIFM